MRILFVVNEPWFFLSHRLPIAKAVYQAGYEVHVATIGGAAVTEICSQGFIHHVLPVSRSGKKPFQEIKLLYFLFHLFRKVKPDIVHLVTIKPVLYGGIAARLAGVPAVVAAVSGLGFVFIVSGFKARFIRIIVMCLYRAAFGMKNLRVIFQNPDDRAVLLKNGVVAPGKAIMIRGSGVDLSVYKFLPEPDDIPVVTFAARLLREKGVREFVDAARILLKQGVKARFLLAGDLDPGNPNSITPVEIDKWRYEGHIELLGFRNDIADIFAASNIVVLPSYYGEGLPKVLIEAAACGRAVVTTDHPGCRDAIKPGISGLLVPVRNTEALADSIKKLLEDEVLRKEMGEAGRKLVEKEFTIEKIVEEHIKIYQELIARI